MASSQVFQAVQAISELVLYLSLLLLELLQLPQDGRQGLANIGIHCCRLQL
jgi:hypothetical protein